MLPGPCPFLTVTLLLWRSLVEDGGSGGCCDGRSDVAPDGGAINSGGSWEMDL